MVSGFREGLQKIISTLIGVPENQKNLMYQLKKDGWRQIEEWKNLYLLQKKDEQIIYNPEFDEIVRRYTL